VSRNNRLTNTFCCQYPARLNTTPTGVYKNSGSQIISSSKWKVIQNFQRAMTENKTGNVSTT